MKKPREYRPLLNNNRIELTKEEIEAINDWIDSVKQTTDPLFGIGILHASKRDVRNFIVRDILSRLLGHAL